MGYVNFNGVSSASLGLVVQTPPVESYSSKDVESVHITGRNGDIILDHDSYKNGTRIYNFAVAFPDLPCIEVKGLVYIRDQAKDKNINIGSSAVWCHAFTCPDPDISSLSPNKTMLINSTSEDEYAIGSAVYNYSGVLYSYISNSSVKSGMFGFYTRVVTHWIHSANSYAVLRDSYSPDVYRMAIFYDGGSYTNGYDQGTAFEVAFVCKPQKFLKAFSGAYEIPWDQVQQQWFSIINPTDQIAKPVIGPSAVIPQTVHYPYITVTGNSSYPEYNNTKFFRYEAGDRRGSSYRAWINKTYNPNDGDTHPYKIVYTATTTPSSGTQVRCGQGASFDVVGTVNNYEDNLVFYKIKIGKKSGANFETDDHWIIDIDNDYGEVNKITINSEYMECYYENPSTGEITLKNHLVSISGTEGFPLLFPGENYIWFDNGGTPTDNKIPLVRNYWSL